MRYARQRILPEIGDEGQKRLSGAKVLVAGCGGLGSPAALYLAGAGVGKIGIADDDRVNISNLQRQILYSEKETGRPKVLCAVERLSALNSEIEIIPHFTRITEDNAEELIGQYDIVVDGTDNFRTRYLISDVCSRLHKPYVYGAIGEFTGQVSVLCYGNPGDPLFRSYRDIFPDEEAMYAMSEPSKAVMGVTPAITGSIEASETIKLICGFGQVLAGKLWTYDLRSNSCIILDI